MNNRNNGFNNNNNNNDNSNSYGNNNNNSNIRVKNIKVDGLTQVCIRYRYWLTGLISIIIEFAIGVKLTFFWHFIRILFYT